MILEVFRLYVSIAVASLIVSVIEIAFLGDPGTVAEAARDAVLWPAVLCRGLRRAWGKRG